MNMDTLFLTPLIPKYKTVDKDRLFYNRFEYCLAFHLDEASCLRNLSHENIDIWVKRRKTWREISQQRWSTSPNRTGTVLTRRWREITQQTVSHLHCVAEILLLSGVEYKLVVSVDQVWVYTDHSPLLDRLDQLDFLHYKTWTKACITHPKNTVVLKHSQYQFRSYLKTCNLTDQQRQNLENFMNNHSTTIRLAPSVQRWMDMPCNRIQDYYFIDHDSMSWTTMLGLIVPGIIRKTVPIISGK